jgi:hypothetical protein
VSGASTGHGAPIGAIRSRFACALPGTTTSNHTISTAAGTRLALCLTTIAATAQPYAYTRATAAAEEALYRAFDFDQEQKAILTRFIQEACNR